MPAFHRFKARKCAQIACALASWRAVAASEGNSEGIPPTGGMGESAGQGVGKEKTDGLWSVPSVTVWASALLDSRRLSSGAFAF